ncbi:MAG TPA: site-specific DNA-methyltransferase [Aliidongia sp.]|uniref:DNA-methyltransferase n=1 Tax=Aliidongia sp. TaxID=1914230 RepID=UPI002DDCE9FD|nr:site-specific DNA-methyltransferase [Aliidongia sp.]HEV2673271.1 site-specific DNA-methyltransferase [Aliidongia sp.]
MTTRILVGDCRSILRTLPDRSVHCCVTSPPYFGLRDYGVDGQIGLEATPSAFVKEMVAVFREVRRVLRDDGTLWLNLGDSYNGQGARSPNIREDGSLSYRAGGQAIQVPGLKSKDLIGIPWRVAFALQADGWYLRSDIIWSKPNPMPESVTDRPTKAHEYLFLLSKSARYFYDADAIREVATVGDNGSSFTGERDLSVHPNRGMKRRSGNKARKPGTARGCPDGTGSNVCGSVPWEGEGRNKRSVWTVATAPFKEAHFATFPPALIEDCIKAGCPKGGLVMDPFGGAGTTGLVADRLQRDALLIELNPEYALMARRRILGDATLLGEVA